MKKVISGRQRSSVISFGSISASGVSIGDPLSRRADLVCARG
jgi:hypothetical protein